MASESRAERAAWLVLWHQRDPSRFERERAADPRPPDAEVVLKLALGRRVALADPALGGLGAGTLREAAAWYVRRQFFRPDATPYQTLGLPPFASDRAIKSSFRLLMQLVHPDRQHADGAWPEACAAQANRAYADLRHATARERLDRSGRRGRAQEPAGATRADTCPPTWKKPVRHRPPSPVLPEWLTAGVGGFARAHPAVVAFGALVAIALLMIGFAAREGPPSSLVREARDPVFQASSPVAAHADAAPATAPAPPDVGAIAREPVAAPLPVAATRTPTVHGAPAHGEATPRPSPAAVPARPPAPPPALAPASTPETAPANVPAPSAPAAATAPSPALAPAPAPAAPRPAMPAQAADASPARIAAAALAAPSARPPTTDEIEGLFVALVDAYDRGRSESLAALFDIDGSYNERQGRDAVRREFDELFRGSEWRRMRLMRVSWRQAGDSVQSRAEVAVRIGWRDGRQVDQRVALDVEFARRDGRVVITRMAQQAGPP